MFSQLTIPESDGHLTEQQSLTASSASVVSVLDESCRLSRNSVARAMNRFRDKVNRKGLDIEELLDNLDKVKRELARERFSR